MQLKGHLVGALLVLTQVATLLSDAAHAESSRPQSAASSQAMESSPASLAPVQAVAASQSALTPAASSSADVASPACGSDTAVCSDTAREPVAEQREHELASGVNAVAASPLKLRRVKDSELNLELIARAAELIRHHGREHKGSRFVIELDGRRYVAVLETHYHPEGGSAKPWGYHPGLSLFVAS